MTKKIDKLPITNDYVFKRVFSYEGNESVLKDFLEAILDIKINKIEVKNPELIKSTKEEKSGILDIKVEIDDNTIIDVEMQMENEYNMEERSTKEAYVNMGYQKEDKIASKYMEMHFIELPKFKKKNPDMKARISQWLWLLAGEEEKVEMAEKENEEVKKAVETLNRISLDPKERERYESIIQAEFNHKISNQKFLEKGKKEEKIQIAKKMLQKDTPVEEVAEITELTEEEIEKIKRQILESKKSI